MLIIRSFVILLYYDIFLLMLVSTILNEVKNNTNKKYVSQAFLLHVLIYSGATSKYII